MNTKRVLAFGDSNTFGYDPVTGGRLPAAQRWTRQLSAALPGVEIIEEGLNGRTTVFDDPFCPGRNGARALPGCLNSHKPLDLVVLALGANDLKRALGQTPESVTRGMERLIQIVAAHPWHAPYARPDILIVAPPVFGKSAADGFLPELDATSVEQSKKLSALYEAFAARCGVGFLGTSDIAPGADGVHYDAAGHRALAAKLAVYLKENL